MAKVYDAHVYLGEDPQWKQLGLPVPLDADGWIKMLDGAGMEGALIAPAGTGAADDYKQDHERIARGIKRHPGRILGMCRVRPRNGKSALTTLRRCVEDQGFKALLLHTSDDGYTLRERSIIDPLVEEAGRLGIPVVFDAVDASWPSCSPSMVADIAVDFPDTTFVIGRMGFGGVNGWPGTPQETVPAMKRAPNTVCDTAGVFLSKLIQDTVEAVGVERVLMASNAPYSPVELSRIMVMKHLNKLTQQQKEQVAGGNLARVLKLGS